MLIVIPVAKPEVDRALDLFGWIEELGGCGNRSLLLVFAHPVPEGDARALSSLAAKSFSNVEAIQQRSAAEFGWPRNANAMFSCAANYVAKRDIREPWLWCEVDAIPIVPNWADKIEAAYNTCGRPVLGCVYMFPSPHVNGVAVYPANLRSINPGMVDATLRPFDLVHPDFVRKRAHTTSGLIVRSLEDPRKNRPHTFPDLDSLSKIPEGCVLFHGNKDGSLIHQLRRRNHYKPPELVIKKSETLFQKVVNAINPLYRTVYYHSGNIGDIIYALAAIKKSSDGDLIIGPQQNGTSPCAVPIQKPQFDAMLGLLQMQPYLRSVKFSENYPADKISIDLNTFRDNWDNTKIRTEQCIHNLALMHFYTLGIQEKFDPEQSWLYIENPIPTNRIIVHRSKRYRSNLPPFPWREFVNRFADKILFVGYENEYAEFSNSFGKVSFWKVRDITELAQLIAGGVAFVGNQSAPCAIALGYGKCVWQEAWFEKSADCLFPRQKRFMTQRDSIEKFSKWISL